MKYIGKFPASEGFPKCQELNAELPLPKSELENINWREGFDAVGATDGVLLDANDLENEGDFRLVHRRLTYRRVVVRLGTIDDFSLRFFSKPGEPTELQNQKLIENS